MVIRTGTRYIYQVYLVYDMYIYEIAKDEGGIEEGQKKSMWMDRQTGRGDQRAAHFVPLSSQQNGVPAIPGN